MTSPITTHLLDIAKGSPAAGVAIRLEKKSEQGSFAEVGHGSTDADGRLKTLLAPGSLTPGVYRITFELEAYFQADGGSGFYPEASVVFVVKDAGQHYHLPLLLSPFGYSTYRGS